MEKIKHFLKRKEILPRLILINIAVFLVVNVLDLIGWFFKVNTIAGLSSAAYYLSVPAELSSLIIRPWTLLTYMFTQEGFLHLLFNIMVLYFGGQIFQQFLSSKKLLFAYLMGGLFGAVFFIAAYNIFPVFENQLAISVALGSSASVMAILFTAVTFSPDLSVQLLLFGKIKLKYLALILFVFDLLSIKGGSNSGGHISHIGGAAFGLLFGYLIRKRILNMDDFLKKVFDFFKFSKKKKFTVHEGGRPLTDEQFNDLRAEKKHQLDEILDKISKHGYERLTKSEKEFLFRQSNKKG